MWLEELVWLWLPVVGGVAGWMIRRLISLTAEVRGLRARVEQLEQASNKPQWSKVA